MNGSQGHVERAQTIAQLFWQLAGARGDAVMMRQKELGIWQSYSWNAVRETVSDIAAGLIELGLQPGEVISILSNTRREWLWADLGGLAAGAVVSGVYPTDSASQLEYLCDDSRSVYLFVEDEEQLDKYLTVRERLPGMRRVIVFDMKGLEDFEDPQVMSLDRLCELGRARRQRHPDEVAQRLQSRGREDLAILVYTSGTTGRPKGAMLSNANLLAAIGALDRFLPRLHDAERVSFLPMCHVSERIIGTYYAMLGGARMNFVERPETVFENIQEIQPHLFGGVPRIWEKLYSRVTTAVSEAAPFQQWAYRKAIAWGMAAARHRERGEPVPWPVRARAWLAHVLVLDNVRRMMGLHRTRVAITGAAPISPDLLRWYLALGIELDELWGMSELAGAAACNPPGRARIGSVGVPMPDMELRISPEGELQVRGPQVFMGYLNLPDKTAETFDDGWLRTGDVGRCDPDGYFYITDRMKDIIITAGGKNITPSEWENQLKFSPYVTDAVVIGDKRPYLTCLVMIDQENVERWAQERNIPFSDFRSLTRNPEVIRLIGEEIEKVNQEFARVEQIKQFRLIEQRLTAEDEEMTPTMKLKRKLVSQKYAELIESMYAAKAA
ncbi:long-chain fatty acid--CoA ligase [Caldimonas thermodepolymerans]|jgi:Long-chain acyl-CoA synthetases (AMP-forming)|uniref:Long-chain acyl-CoA synthetase n=1 Tax=Caldimonas thermodepolymerans TaxID=215580 RepID=A0A2S5T562_9BURK|nr:long-chain fatty acid--CoA ligase [Caldimonas thermodepolymerans]PPE70134.1 long-chain fatty acid--CoA ligase [Caldimonas thermodepolymerans]QPC32127.1 long-chain fatty acid--CoA ligase [Caldimonas thermodepolymerans]RDH98011.1 long-chain acyl-CoA synthetase [Caldimonas thermodepolymerans]TCP08214.1 long-chain acyl-CoA synthetase [Caldimonas thermodepolymerans]UZG48670.1 long-chain fatty acid--CoA ligase [Caldimonas thermodepolymerans]